MMLHLLNLSRKRKEISLWVLALVLLNPTLGQDRKCGTMEYLDQQVRSNPNITYRMRQIETQTRENVKSIYRHAEEQIEIPVVIHVVYKTPEQNISDAQIMSQIRVLNEDFQRLNADRNKTPEVFRNVAANSHISFRLASLDPQGNPTKGITRSRTNIAAFYSSDNGVKYSAMGGVDAWPTSANISISGCVIWGWVYWAIVSFLVVQPKRMAWSLVLNILGLLVNFVRPSTWGEQLLTKLGIGLI